MQWRDLINDPAFRDRPFDVETTERGQIIVTPVSDNHAYFCGEIAYLLRTLLPYGVAQTETPLTTRAGTKSPDVTWCSRRIHEMRRNKVESPLAPEICVEVLSPSNSPGEIEEKITLYFEQGAQEVWICDTEGKLSFYASGKPVEHSDCIPTFPKEIQL